MPLRAEGIRRDDSTDGRVRAIAGFDRQQLIVLREQRVERAEPDAGLDRDGLIFRRVLDDAIERGRAHHGIERARRVAEFEFRPAPDERERLPGRVQFAHHRGKLLAIGRNERARRGHAGDRNRLRHPRPASPLRSIACGTYTPGRSPHKCGVGKSLSGLSIPVGSNAARTSFIVSRSASENCSPR